MSNLGCASLGALRDYIGDCHRCPLGSAGRTQVVFGVGAPDAAVVLVGEAPGKNEDIQGEPFVGAAGQYLNELLGHAGLKREEIYIANVIKCRPPGNRDPEPVEIETCIPFLREQIRLIAPEVIVTLGNFATKFILKTETGITKLHGSPQQAGRFTVMPMYHPAAAIYDRSKRDSLAEDFTRIGDLLRERGLAGSADAAASPSRASGSDEPPVTGTLFT